LSLGTAARNARWSGDGREHAGAADHGAAVRRLHGRLSRSRHAVPHAGRPGAWAAGDVGPLPALLPLDLSGRAFHRDPARQQGTRRRADGDYRRRRRRDPQSVDLVRAAHGVSGNLAGAIPRAVVRYAGLIQRRYSRAHFGDCRRDRGLPLQHGHADGSGRVLRCGGGAAAIGGDLRGIDQRLGATKERTMKRNLTLLILVAAMAFPALAKAAEIDWKKVDAALGKTAAVSGEVHRYGLPRSDLHVTLDGVTIKPALALGGWVAFAPVPGEAMVMGDLVLLDSEITPVMTKLLEGGLDITAIHNHILRAQ